MKSRARRRKKKRAAPARAAARRATPAARLANSQRRAEGVGAAGLKDYRLDKEGRKGREEEGAVMIQMRRDMRMNCS